MPVEFYEIVCVIFLPILTYLLYLLIFALIHWRNLYIARQKTRNPQRRRAYRAGPDRRHSVSQQEPTIYVSPSNLPPPPKYEALAPPSYDEVVGIHGYPNYQSTLVQPITQPITTALAQTSNAAANQVPSNSSRTVALPATSPPLPETDSIPTVVTVANERRTTMSA